ncbi:MAG: VOC family protein [Nannocystaceae bacterium]
MSTRGSYPPGVFCWVDLMTTDAATAKVFYTGLFGWDFVDDASQPGGVYTMYRHRGHMVAGMGEMNPSMKASSEAPGWNNYIATDDMDDFAAKVTAQGGTTVFPPMDVGQAGRLAFFTDPEGVKFAAWQAGEHCGSTLVNEPGAPLWTELATRDLAQAEAFYGGLCGWSFHTSTAKEDTYTHIKIGGRSVGGVRCLGGGEEANISPHWVPYFAVADLHATAAKVGELGGRVLVGPVDIDVGTFIAISDPQGAVFMAMQLTVDEEPL